MIKVTGKRGSGKTTKLLELAHENGYILIEPNHAIADFARHRAKECGYDDVQVITLNDFWKHNSPFGNDRNYLIDELDMCLHYLGVDGYSNTEVEESNA